MRQPYFGLFLGYRKIQGCERGVFETRFLWEKGGEQMRRGGLWVCSSAWCEKGIMRRLYKTALRVGGES